MGIRLEVFLESSDGTPPDTSPTFAFEFDLDRVVIGRHASSDVRLPHAGISGNHAVLNARGTGYAIEDSGSTNGTWVNGHRIPPGRPKPLKTGDVIQMGEFTLHATLGHAVAQATNAERTSDLAREMLRGMLANEKERALPRLIVLNGPREGQEVTLTDGTGQLHIGRDDSCELTLPDGDASRKHAEIRWHTGAVTLRDLGSKNGIQVNEREIQQQHLHHRDGIQIGATMLMFEDPAEESLKQVTHKADIHQDPPTRVPQSRQSSIPPGGSDDTSASSESIPQDGIPPRAPQESGGQQSGGQQSGGQQSNGHSAHRQSTHGQQPETQRNPAHLRRKGKRAPKRTDLLILGMAAIVLVVSLFGITLLLRP